MNTYSQAAYSQARPMYETFHRPRRVICGVCAAIADRTGAPVWMPRLAAVILLLSHGLLALILYFAGAIWLKRPQAGAVGAAPPPPSWDRNGLVDRFDTLNSRLSRMEAEAMDHEAGLRRAFRDLDRS